MPEPKVTPWYAYRIQPKREGWYEYSGINIYPGLRLYWNGRQWGYWASECNYGANNWVHWADFEGDKWRGLRKSPGGDS